MKKNLKSREVLDELQKKVDLKIALRDAKKEHNDEDVEKLYEKAKIRFFPKMRTQLCI